MAMDMRGSVSSAYLLYHLNNFTILYTGHPGHPSGPRTPAPPGIPSNLTQSQHSKLREHLLALGTISNIFLMLHSQDKHPLNIIGCWIYAELCLFRPAGRKFSIAKAWLKSPQWAFNAQHPEFKPQLLS